MTKNLNKAAVFLADPNELSKLDGFVSHAIFQYDNNIWTSSYDTPPTEEECKAKEQEWEKELTNEYNQAATKYTGRKEIGGPGGGDNIAVRRRIMRRQFTSRRGKLFGRFSEQVDNLKAQASAAISLAVESFDETKESLQASFPCLEATIIGEFAQLKSSIKSQIDASFPGGEEALDLYDDDLDDGVPSLDELRSDIDMEQSHLIAANGEVCAEALLDVKRAIRAQTIEQLTAALDDIKQQLEVSLPFLDSAASEAVLQSGTDELDNFQHDAVGKLMDDWAGFSGEGDKEEDAAADEPEAEAEAEEA